MPSWQGLVLRQQFLYYVPGGTTPKCIVPLSATFAPCSSLFQVLQQTLTVEFLHHQAMIHPCVPFTCTHYTGELYIHVLSRYIQFHNVINFLCITSWISFVNNTFNTSPCVGLEGGSYWLQRVPLLSFSLDSEELFTKLGMRCCFVQLSLQLGPQSILAFFGILLMLRLSLGDKNSGRDFTCYMLVSAHFC